MKFMPIVRLAAVAALQAMAAAAYAGGGGLGGIVYDPTNFAKNTMTASQTAKQVIESIQQTKQQVLMAQKMVNDVKGLNVKSLVGYADPEMARQLSVLDGAKRDLENLNSTLGTADQRFRTKVNAASNMGISVGELFKRQLQERESGSVLAAKTIQRDIETMQGTQAVIKQAQQWRGQLAGLNENLGGSMQLLNSQLNQVAATNAEMLAYAARESAAATQRAEDSANQAAADKVRGAAMHEAADKSLQDSVAKARSSAQSLGTLNIFADPKK